MHKKNNRRLQCLRACGSMVLAALTLPIIITNAQPLETYSFFHLMPPAGDHAKNYSTEAIDRDHSVMAGTLTLAQDPCFVFVPHFLAVDNTATPTASKYYTTVGYQAQRAIDIAVDHNDPAYSYVTVWMRPMVQFYTFPNNCFSSTPVSPTDRDVFKVMRIDNTTGALTQKSNLNSTDDEVTVWDNRAIPAGQTYGNSLFPLNSLYHEYTIASTTYKRLYVCGFVCEENTILEGDFKEPTYHNKKECFIVAIDVDPTHNNIGGTYMRVQEKIYFDFPIPNPQYPAGGKNDYDIPLRMKALSNGNIAVTGSANIQNVSGAVAMATMAVVVDPTLASIITPNSFDGVNPVPGSKYDPRQYGVDIYQNGSSDEYIIASNIVQPNPVGDEVIGSSLVPQGMAFTNLYNTDMGNVGPTQWETAADNKWGLHILEHQYSPDINTTGMAFSNIITSRFILAGLGYKDCDPPGYAAWDDINAFLLDVNLATSLNSGVRQFENPAPPNWHLNDYQNMFGTNNDLTYMNGGGLSSIHLLPTFASRWTSGDPIQMNAPINDPSATFNNLGLKLFHAQETGFSVPNPIAAFCGNLTCSLPTPALNNTQPGITAIKITDYISDALSSPIVQDENWINTGNCETGVYKHGSTTKVATAKKAIAKTTIAPNPATDEISVTLASDIAKDAKVQVVLHNMMGQVVGKLYEGSAAKLITASKLHLPAVASGMYTVQVISNGKTVHQQKLAIQ